jgi:cation transport ATPase
VLLNVFFLAAAQAGSGYLEVAIGISAFILLGKYIEELIRRHLAASIRKLLELQPTTVRDRKQTDMPIENEGRRHNHC